MVTTGNKSSKDPIKTLTMSQETQNEHRSYQVAGTSLALVNQLYSVELVDTAVASGGGSFPKSAALPEGKESEEFIGSIHFARIGNDA